MVRSPFETAGSTPDVALWWGSHVSQTGPGRLQKALDTLGCISETSILSGFDCNRGNACAADGKEGSYLTLNCCNTVGIDTEAPPRAVNAYPPKLGNATLPGDPLKDSWFKRAKW